MHRVSTHTYIYSHIYMYIGFQVQNVLGMLPEMNERADKIKTIDLTDFSKPIKLAIFIM